MSDTDLERAALRALPPEPFILKEVQIATVGANYHEGLREDRHYYSVPYYLRRRDEKTEAKIVYDERVVSIYHDHLRVARHLRDRTPNGYDTLPEHMPEAQRRYGEWNAERLTRWAQEVAPEVLEVITKVLQSRTYAPQAFRACLKADRSYLRELGKVARRELILIDDFGLEALDTASRLSLLEILEDRHGRASTLIASQLPVAKRHELIGDPTIADAICDRIVHSGHRIELKGESVRKLYAQRAKEPEVAEA